MRIPPPSSPPPAKAPPPRREEASPPPQVPSPRRRRKYYGPVTAMVDLLGWPVVGLTAVGFLGWLDWRLDLASHFRTQYAMALSLLALLALLRGRRVRAAVLLVAMFVNAGLVAWYWMPRAGVEPASGPELSLVMANVLGDNEEKGELLGAIEARRPDVVVLMEVDHAWLTEARRVLHGYQPVVEAPRGDSFGIAMYARAGSSWQAVGKTAWMPPEQTPAIDAAVRHVGDTQHLWRLLALHPVPPLDEQASADRDAALDAAGAWARQSPGLPKIVLGDLNASPWSAGYRRLTDDAGLVDAQRGFGLEPTWPAKPGWPAWLNRLSMIPIDHVLHGEGLVAVGHEAIPAPGSDHRMVLVRLRPSRALAGADGSGGGEARASAPR